MPSKNAPYRLPELLTKRINGVSERMGMRPSFVVEACLLYCLDRLHAAGLVDTRPSNTAPMTGAPSHQDDAERLRKLLYQTEFIGGITGNGKIVVDSPARKR